MLILASQSATRKSLLAGAGLRFTSLGAPVDERAVERDARANGAGPEQIALELAGAKALSVSHLNPGAVVIGADQTLEFEGALLHKPLDLAGARAQLSLLVGKTHRLHAGVALAQDGKVLWSALDSAQLTMRAVSVAERDQVLACEGAAVLATVGGYRLEGPSIRLFDTVDGNYFTILGLPLLPLLAGLRIHAPACLNLLPDEDPIQS